MVSGDSKIQKKFREAILYALRPPEGSNFLIINRTSDDLAGLAENVAREIGLKVSKFDLDFQGPYESFPSQLKNEIASRKYPRGMGFFSYPEEKDWKQKETPARVELIHGCIKKVPIGYMHAPGIDRDMALNGAVQCDYKKMAETAEKMLGLLEGVKSLHVTAPAGTSLDIEIPPEVKGETDCVITPPGLYGEEGRMGNIPNGEVEFLRRKKVSVAGREVEYPVKLIGNGSLICDVCADNIDKLVEPDKPIQIQLRDGILTYFHSDDETFNVLNDEWMNRELEYRTSMGGLPAVLEEAAIGINDKARKSANLLETEKRKGTAHFAIGHVRSHSDFVIDEPTITAVLGNKKERVIMEDGKLIFD